METFHDTMPLKYGLSAEEIRTKLNADYNTFPLQIMTTTAFLEQTIALLNESHSPIDFYEQLGKQRKMKLAELNHSFGRFGYRAFVLQDAFGPDHGRLKQVRAVKVFSERSFDVLVEFFDAFLYDTEDGASTSIEAVPEEPDTRQYLAPPSKIFQREEIPTDAQPDDRSRSRWDASSLWHEARRGNDSPPDQPKDDTTSPPSPILPPSPDPSSPLEPPRSSEPPQPTNQRRTKRRMQKMRDTYTLNTRTGRGEDHHVDPEWARSWGIYEDLPKRATKRSSRKGDPT